MPVRRKTPKIYGGVISCEDGSLHTLSLTEQADGELTVDLIEAAGPAQFPPKG